MVEGGCAGGQAERGKSGPVGQSNPFEEASAESVTICAFLRSRKATLWLET